MNLYRERVQRNVLVDCGSSPFKHYRWHFEYKFGLYISASCTWMFWRHLNNAKVKCTYYVMRREVYIKHHGNIFFSFQDWGAEMYENTTVVTLYKIDHATWVPLKGSKLSINFQKTELVDDNKDIPSSSSRPFKYFTQRSKTFQFVPYWLYLTKGTKCIIPICFLQWWIYVKFTYEPLSLSIHKLCTQHIFFLIS